MRTSHLLVATLKEVPADADITSQQLMLRAGLIRKLASGLYTWLPLGLRVLRKVEAIVRDEMNRVHGQEILMPAIQPAELWQETQRWDQYGPMLLKMTDRHQRLYCFGPTHEEIVTDLLRGELTSYKQLPLCLYQIQTKFRDEIRPRFGVMRAREFIMKDAYSFDVDVKGMEKSYAAMYGAYHAIFTRLGLRFRAVQADSGEIGGSQSHEFQVLADAGEDLIFYSNGGTYAANRELASAALPVCQSPTEGANLTKIATPNLRSIASIVQALNIPIEKTVKCVLVKGIDTPVIAFVLRGDHELNDTKASKCPRVMTPLTMSEPQDILNACGAEPGSIGPIGLTIPFYIDRDAIAISDFTCGANSTDFHYTQANWRTDVLPAYSGELLNHPQVRDLRNVVVGDKSPHDDGHLQTARGIEVGHVFQLGCKYTQAMNLTVLDAEGQSITPFMGCYGIGISRIVAAAIEQHHDDKGILWPASMSPYAIALVGLNSQKCPDVAHATEQVYHSLSQAGFDVLWDDRQERPGVLFADLELIGIPHRLVISTKTLANQQIEYKNRRSGEIQLIDLATIDAFCQGL